LDPYAKTSLPTFFLESSSVRHRELADASAAAPLPKSPATGTFQEKKNPWPLATTQRALISMVDSEAMQRAAR